MNFSKNKSHKIVGKTIKVLRISKYALEKLNTLGYVVIITGGGNV